jgi:hypothetical protein
VEVLRALGALQGLRAAPALRQLLAVLVPKVEECWGYLTVEQLGIGMQILEAFGDCEEVRQLTAALTAKVRSTRGANNYGGLALTGMQSWEQSGVMQNLMKALEEEQTDPAGFTVPGPQPLPFVSGEALPFANEKAFDWLQGFRTPEVQLMGGSSSSGPVRAPDDEDGEPFIPLPIPPGAHVWPAGYPPLNA